MRKISYMYEKSGGTNRFHICSECPNYVQPDRDYNYKTCALHPERPIDWSADHTACRFYCGKRTQEEKESITKTVCEFGAQYYPSAAVKQVADAFRSGEIDAEEVLNRTARISGVLSRVHTVPVSGLNMHQMTIDEWIKEEGI